MTTEDSEKMEITVVVCTYNRCHLLHTALKSIAASILPENIRWEVLVVDNNSSDGTREIAAQFCTQNPARFRYFFEPQPGLSVARNTGIRVSKGEVIVFTDDDVIVEPTWLHNLTRTLHDGEWAGAGGRIVPLRPSSMPHWLALTGPYKMGGIVAALFDHGDTPGPLDEPPFGANMAFRRKIFAKYGGFRTDLGRRPGSLMSHEDTEFGRRLQSAGERLRYEPFAVVCHPLIKERMQKDYILNWWLDSGRAMIRDVETRPDVWGIPRPYLSLFKRAAVLAPANLFRWLFALTPQKRFYRKCWVWCTVGEILELTQRLFLETREQQNSSPHVV
jgi:glycosyltransferase involved in cell wall biosynthesis